ncbi:hypothetical protein [Paenactinomyces guangxiensis]|uniref:Uncharacterized protein n=1 Tax=Paenactinomyces guangxiensis TaxID=1490290 RepID=A0A7W1WV49_9BACL|nr:hypothetical protein [Paenactinomyces guangxiensis]MBA4496543.1 hypothetical protein [Paenactinomyces guangxiensis]MBH8593678.1 hypothetical protein [Paenactinomyces guangxiensis]
MVLQKARNAIGIVEVNEIHYDLKSPAVICQAIETGKLEIIKPLLSKKGKT